MNDDIIIVTAAGAGTWLRERFTPKGIQRWLTESAVSEYAHKMDILREVDDRIYEWAKDLSVYIDLMEKAYESNRLADLASLGVSIKRTLKGISSEISKVEKLVGISEESEKEFLRQRQPEIPFTTKLKTRFYEPTDRFDLSREEIAREMQNRASSKEDQLLKEAGVFDFLDDWTRSWVAKKLRTEKGKQRDRALKSFFRTSKLIINNLKRVTDNLHKLRAQGEIGSYLDSLKKVERLQKDFLYGSGKESSDKTEEGFYYVYDTYLKDIIEDSISAPTGGSGPAAGPAPGSSPSPALGPGPTPPALVPGPASIVSQPTNPITSPGSPGTLSPPPVDLGTLGLSQSGERVPAVSVTIEQDEAQRAGNDALQEIQDVHRALESGDSEKAQEELQELTTAVQRTSIEAFQAGSAVGENVGSPEPAAKAKAKSEKKVKKTTEQPTSAAVPAGTQATGETPEERDARLKSLILARLKSFRENEESAPLASSTPTETEVTETATGSAAESSAATESAKESKSPASATETAAAEGGKTLIINPPFKAPGEGKTATAKKAITAAELVLQINLSDISAADLQGHKDYLLELGSALNSSYDNILPGQFTNSIRSKLQKLYNLIQERSSDLEKILAPEESSAPASTAEPAAVEGEAAPINPSIGTEPDGPIKAAELVLKTNLSDIGAADRQSHKNYLFELEGKLKKPIPGVERKQQLDLFNKIKSRRSTLVTLLASASSKDFNFLTKLASASNKYQAAQYLLSYSQQLEDIDLNKSLKLLALAEGLLDD